MLQCVPILLFVVQDCFGNFKEQLVVLTEDKHMQRNVIELLFIFEFRLALIWDIKVLVKHVAHATPVPINLLQKVLELRVP